jgi:hypothetical protein
MAAPRTVDVKIKFEQTDMVPGPAGRQFQRNLLLHGGESDKRGYSHTDCLLRLDEGAEDAAGNPIAAVPAIPAGAAGNAARQARMRRLKGSFTYVAGHIGDESTLTLIGDPASDMFQNGPNTYDYVIGKIVIPYTAGEIRELTLAWWATSMPVDIGMSENSVNEAVKELRTQNVLGSLGLNDQDICECLLIMIRNASDMLMVEANTELDAPEGPIGNVGVRRFQLAVPAGAAPGAMPLRDLDGIVKHFHRAWKALVVAGRITRAPATKQGRGKPLSKTVAGAGHSGVERGMSAGYCACDYLYRGEHRPRSREGHSNDQHAEVHPQARRQVHGHHPSARHAQREVES